MAEKIFIADKPTQDKIYQDLALAIQNLNSILDRIGPSNSTDTNTMFGFMRVAATLPPNTIKKVLNGSANISSPNSPVTVTHAEVDPSKSFILFTLSGQGIATGEFRLARRSATNFTIECNAAYAIFFSWQLVEFY